MQAMEYRNGRTLFYFAECGPEPDGKRVFVRFVPGERRADDPPTERSTIRFVGEDVDVEALKRMHDAALASNDTEIVVVNRDLQASDPMWNKHFPAPPQRPSCQRPGFASLDALRGSEITPRPIEWLWHERVPLGKITLLAGDPGLGKSMLTMDIAARISQGAPLPGEREAVPRYISNPGSVLILSAEDDPADTLVPRLITHGAELGRIAFVRGVREPTATRTTSFDLKRDVYRLEHACRAMDNLRLIIIDPLSAYLSDGDTHNDAAVRSILAPLAEVAAKRHLAVLGVMHLNKSPGGKSVYRLNGSLAFPAAARAVWLVTRDQENDSRRLLMPVKMNLCAEPKGLAYSIRQNPDAAPTLDWESTPLLVKADEAMASGDEQPVTSSMLEDACAFLRIELVDDPVPTNQIIERAKSLGIQERTLRRARARMNLDVCKRVGDGAWVWALPGMIPRPMRAPHSTQKPLVDHRPDVGLEPPPIFTPNPLPEGR
jgi:hypothetical protein